MVAALDDGEDGGGAGRHAGRDGDGPVSAFERGNRFLERHGGRRTEPAVDDIVEYPRPDFPPLGQAPVRNCRGVVHGRIDGAEMPFRMAAGADNFGIGFHGEP